VSPLHDLDVLYILGAWNPASHSPATALQAASNQLKASFRNPTPWRVKVTPQTHSVSLTFSDERGKEILSVDIVPAFISGVNEFREHTYVVPEIAQRGHAARARQYQRIQEQHIEMKWIKSDPRGYISVSHRVNNLNADFRKSVKIAKGWHYSCKKLFDSKLKSFHIEQIITSYFVEDGNSDIFDAVFRFFVELPDWIRRPQIRDRADENRFIDQYLEDLGIPERRAIIEARDGFLIKLENFESNPDVGNLLKAEQRERRSASEQYLFDQNIPVLEEHAISIEALALQGGGWRQSLLDKLGLIKRDRQIRFRVRPVTFQVDLFKWKVKNDDASKQPRGEITDNRTRSDPEHTVYDGNHYVECYAIRKNICIAKARQLVTLDRSP